MARRDRRREAAAGPESWRSRPPAPPAGVRVQLDRRGGHSCFHWEANTACAGAGPVDAGAEGSALGVRSGAGAPRLRQAATLLLGQRAFGGRQRLLGQPGLGVYASERSV